MATFQVRFPAGTAYEIAQKNPILGKGEPFYETDTAGVKIGDGTQRYNDLPYAGIVLEQGPRGDDGDEGPAGRGVLSILGSDRGLVFHMTDQSEMEVIVPAIAETDDDRRAAEAAAAGAEQARQDAADAAREALETVSSGLPNATSTIKGGIRLTGDLSGTWDNPQVPGLAAKADREFGEVVGVYESGDMMTLDLSTPGVYRVRGGPGFVTNMPNTTDLWWNVLVAYDGPTESKLIFATSTNSPTAYLRVRHGSTWGGWINVSSPYSALTVAEGKTGTSTTLRAIRAIDLRQIMNFALTGNETTVPTQFGQMILTTPDHDAAREALGAEEKAQKGQPNGYAGLDNGGKVPAAQLPSYVDDVMEYASLAAFPATGETGKIFVATDTDKQYRWSGTAYREISKPPVETVAGKSGNVTLTAADISDAGQAGRAAVRAETPAQARDAIGAGTSNLTIGTTASTAMAGDRIQRVTSLPAAGGTPGVLYCVPKV